jgi:NADH dehydrogenase (ubiquinone) Fe-S protein 4
MSARSIGPRLLAPALRPSAARALAPSYRAYVSTKDAPAVPVDTESTQIRKENAAQGLRHAPDYNVAIDYRTSCALPASPAAPQR